MYTIYAVVFSLINEFIWIYFVSSGWIAYSNKEYYDNKVPEPEIGKN